MKKILLASLFSFSAYAVELTFIGPCSDKFIMRTQVNENYATVGELTVATLTKFGIPFLGTDQGLNSVFETPVGMDALEILSDTEMRSYGWCYAVNGVSPEVFPHEIPLTDDIQSITWTFGFAHFKNGQWLSLCTPAHQVKPAQMCEKESE